jgi:hypothetical protein
MRLPTANLAAAGGQQVNVQRSGKHIREQQKGKRRKPKAFIS